MKKILVIGSLNMDTVLEVPHQPQRGETLSGRSLALVPGGKGANQAYAAGKLGGSVAMIGAVGKDSAGDALLENLRSVHVDVSGICQTEQAPTGQAFITVDDSGDNSIIIIAGTNALVTEQVIDDHLPLIRSCDIIVMQLEIPLETVMYAKELARKLGKTVIVDPAPALPHIPDAFWQGIDYIKPNETELSILTGCRSESPEEIAASAGILIEKGVKNVLVSLGEKGCMLVTPTGAEIFEAHKVQAVDTTAAGDSFTAAFALALSQGKSAPQAIRFGQKVSAIAVTRKGAQTSIPTPEEVESTFDSV